jgi:hypothetical protein
MSKHANDLDSDLGEILRPANSRVVRWGFGLGFALLAALVIVSHVVAN